MSVIDRIRSGTTSEKDIEELKIINRQWGIAGFITGMFITLLIIGVAIVLWFSLLYG